MKGKKMGIGFGILVTGLLAFSMFKKPDHELSGLNRKPKDLVLSEHAKCRMDCRDIDLTEVKDILKNGAVNPRKSWLDKTACEKRYALEGRTRDRQDVRIVFASCNEKTTVITAIDLNADPECYCP